MRQTSAARRSVVMGLNGAVATSQPLAAQAGLRMLMEGGNAVDAALAAAAALNVVEPASTGIGGDAFALVYWAKDRRVYALNGSGRAPYKATREYFASRGLSTVPARGILSVTVPGAAAAWHDLSVRFGKLGFDRILQPAIHYCEEGYPRYGRLGLNRSLQPAIRYAEEGFAVSERIAAAWARAADVLRAHPETARVYLPGGRAPRAGERFQNPDLAKTLRQVADHGPGSFYRGPIAQAIVKTSDQLGGLLTMEDLADHCSTWLEPISTDYRGYRVWQCPPNGQGIATLMALNTLQGYDLAQMGNASTDGTHLKMEAVKLAMTDAARYVADPEMTDVPVQQLLSDAFARERRAAISMERATANPQAGRIPNNPDTVYISVVDGMGNACSFINSLYMGFGSGITVEGTGILLQNRGNCFTLNPNHPNCIMPHKRPYHTIIPAMVTRNDDLAICYGVMGGFMQPQGQVQVLSNIVDHGMDPQQALDAPRFCFSHTNVFHLEPYFPAGTYDALRARGHVISDAPTSYGGGQVIMVDPGSGALLAGSEPRNDGMAVAF